MTFFVELWKFATGKTRISAGHFGYYSSWLVNGSQAVVMMLTLSMHLITNICSHRFYIASNSLNVLPGFQKIDIKHLDMLGIDFKNPFLHRSSCTFDYSNDYVFSFWVLVSEFYGIRLLHLSKPLYAFGNLLKVLQLNIYQILINLKFILHTIGQ